ncbi:MAG: transketolase C-terminal domain-containing protein, partial [Flavobacteriales bacterium]
LVFERVNKHGKCLVLTEEPYNNSFAQSLVGRIQEHCFEKLDAPVYVMGSENLPAIPLNSTLEARMLPNTEKVSEKIREVLAY